MIISNYRLEKKGLREQVIEQIIMGLNAKGIGYTELVDISFRVKKLEVEDCYA